MAKVVEALTANEAIYLRHKIARQESVTAELNDYAAHLFAVYQLRPGVDNILPDGRIVRGMVPKPGRSLKSIVEGKDGPNGKPVEETANKE